MKKDKNYLLQETIVMLSADLYQVLDGGCDGSWADVAELIINLAKEFEEELDWQDYEERDYIEELEKFEQKVIERLNKGEL